MSRTFRKKNQETSQLDLSEQRVGNKYVSTTQKERMRRLHKEFGDKHSGVRNAPKGFRQGLEAIRRAKAKTEMYKAADIEHEAIFDLNKKNANWEYW